MGAECEVCSHPERAQIERACEERYSSTKIIDRFKLSPDLQAFHKHRFGCMKVAARGAQQKFAPLPTGSSLKACVGRLEGLIERLQAEIESAIESGQTSRITAFSKAVSSISSDVVKLKGLMPDTKAKAGLQKFLDQLGVVSESEAREIIQTGQRMRSMAEEERQLMCERWLAGLYRDSEARNRMLPELKATLEEPGEVFPSVRSAGDPS